MEHTSNLALPYIMPAQAQKHVTHNEAIRMLDTLVQLGVASRALSAPPAEPVEGERHIVGPGASGAWQGREGDVAAWQDGGWSFLAPRAGWLAWVSGETRLLVHDGASWGALGAEAAGLASLGINAVPDGDARLAVAAAASLFTHEGAGHRLAIDKAATADTASILFQTAFEARAEIGLTGDDRLSIRVSEDGETFRTALVIDQRSGAALLPATPCGMVNLLVNGAFTVNQRGFAGGTLAAGAYGYDRWKAGTGGCVVAAAGGLVSHSSGSLVQVIESPGLAGATVTLSVEDLAGGDLAVDVAGEAAIIAAGSGRRKATLTLPTAATDVAVSLLPATSAVTYRRVQLNEGGEAVPFERRHPAQELALCQRYFAAVSGLVMPLQKQRESDRARSVNIWFTTPMRATPTVTLGGVVLGGHESIFVASQAEAGFRVASSGAGTDGSQPYFTSFTSEAEL